MQHHRLLEAEAAQALRQRRQVDGGASRVDAPEVLDLEQHPPNPLPVVDLDPSRLLAVDALGPHPLILGGTNPQLGPQRLKALRGEVRGLRRLERLQT